MKFEIVKLTNWQLISVNFGMTLGALNGYNFTHFRGTITCFSETKKLIT